jgi:diguanylate cyclase
MDRKFLLNDTPRDRIMLVHFARMLQELEIPILAEGIESEAQFVTAAELGVEYAQGYFLGRPITAEQLLAQLARHGLQLPRL